MDLAKYNFPELADQLPAPRKKWVSIENSDVRCNLCGIYISYSLMKSDDYFAEPEKAIWNHLYIHIIEHREMLLLEADRYEQLGNPRAGELREIIKTAVTWISHSFTFFDCGHWTTSESSSLE